MSLDCPQCAKRAACIDSRRTGYGVRRRYQCPRGHRFTSIEMVVPGKHKGGHQTILGTLNKQFAARVEAGVKQRLRELIDK